MAEQRSKRGPVYCGSSQELYWMFQTRATIDDIRNRAHNQAVADKMNLAPRCLPTRGLQKKRPRDGDDNEGSQGSLSPERLTTGEELVIVNKYRDVLLNKWIPGFPALAQNDKIGACAVLFFTRFYLSNSVMEFAPNEIALACILAATKAEGTWGFLPAMSFDGAPVAPRDTSIQETVTLLARDPRERFALIRSAEVMASAQAAQQALPSDNTSSRSGGGGSSNSSNSTGQSKPSGSFVVMDGLPAAEALAMRDRVLQAELNLLDGIDFHLLCFLPFAPLRSLLACLSDRALDHAPDLEEHADERQGPTAKPPLPPVSSGTRAVPLAPKKSASDAPASAPTPSLLKTRAARDLASEYSRAWVRVAMTSDLCLLHPPSLLALSSLLLALQQGPPTAASSSSPSLPQVLEAPVHDEEVVSFLRKALDDGWSKEEKDAIRGQRRNSKGGSLSQKSSTQWSQQGGTTTSSAADPQQAELLLALLGDGGSGGGGTAAAAALLERARLVQTELKAVAATKVKSKLFKDANAKLAQCAVWRESV